MYPVIFVCIIYTVHIIYYICIATPTCISMSVRHCPWVANEQVCELSLKDMAGENLSECNCVHLTDLTWTDLVMSGRPLTATLMT